MEKHMEILIQLLIYDYKQQGLLNLATSIRDKNYIGKVFIQTYINDYLK